MFQLEKVPGSEFICHLQSPAKAGTHRFLVTLVHRQTRQEKLIDLLVDGGGFAVVRRAIRESFGASWEIFESHLTWETSF